ncbi:NAD-dependent epimerase/dehydratase family protein [Williamsia soli]|uniref:NAD-dependent epimerase/dehydratase family protein n=1 Tax=Williamsia soli TaxID=364929 RepID=UPI001A9D458A|nr:NAD(P)-dependent oxidoreductase [Williamsia soli]
MRVFLTGGTGAIGRYTVPALIRGGHAVTALARSTQKADWLRRQGATPIAVSLFDREALARAFDGHDTVVNLASALPSTMRFASSRAWRDCTRIRGEGSATVAAAAAVAGIERIIQESVTMIYRDNGANWTDEDAPVEAYPIARTNLSAEANIRGFAHTGGTPIILRFGLFYGPGATHSEQIFALARRHIGLVSGRPDSYLSCIHVSDGADAVAAALGARAGTYNVVDDEPLTKLDHARACADAAGAAMWIRGPGRAGLLAGHRLTSLTRSVRASNTRFRDESGWRPAYPSAREGWVATARVLTGPRTGST